MSCALALSPFIRRFAQEKRIFPTQMLLTINLTFLWEQPNPSYGASGVR